MVDQPERPSEERLGRAITALAERAPEGAPDVTPVLQGARRSRVRRSIVAGAGAVVLLVSTLLAVNLYREGGSRSTVPPATHRDARFVPAEPGESTYLLSELKIVHPYVDRACMRRQPHGSASLCQSSDTVKVLYDWEWSTQRFPGLVRCRVQLFHKQRLVGHSRWELTGLERTSRRPDNVVVHFNGRVPDRAEATCERSVYEPGPGFRFTYKGSETYDKGKDTPKRIRLLFEVEIVTDHDPSARTCTMRMRFASGKTEKIASTITGLREGPLEYETGFPADDPVEDASIRCRPFTGRTA